MLQLTWMGFVGLTFFGAVIGMAGAAGTIGILTLVGIIKFDANSLTPPNSPPFLQFLVITGGLSVIGGFIARKLLPLLGENLMSRIKETKQDLQAHKEMTAQELEMQQRELQEQQKAKEELRTLGARLDAELTIQSAITALTSKSVERRNTARAAIENYLEHHPRDRRAAILAARFAAEPVASLGEKPDYEQAIKTLTDFLNQPNVGNDDFADALFNRGCYYSKLSGKKTDPAEKQAAANKAIADIAESVRRKPVNKKEAASDDDLAPISQEPAFIAAIAPETFTG
jgi:hypothetical protein